MTFTQKNALNISGSQSNEMLGKKSQQTTFQKKTLKMEYRDNLISSY